MARLIDADALVNVLQRTTTFGCITNSAGKNVFEIIGDMPTTTEAEIKKKTIEDFLEKLSDHETKNWIDHMEYGITWSDLELIAKQMKEE